MLKPEIVFCDIVIVQMNYMFAVPWSQNQCLLHARSVLMMWDVVFEMRLSNSFSTTSPVLHSNGAISV